MEYRESFVRSHFIALLSEKFGINKKKAQQYPSEPLLGETFGLCSFDLVYLYAFVEKTFGIRFSEEDATNYRLLTIDNWVATICKKIG